MPLSLLLRSANSVLSCAMKSPGSHTLQICTMTLLVKNQAYINGKWTSAASGATFDGKFRNNIIIIIIFITYTHGTNKHTHEKNTILKNTH